MTSLPDQFTGRRQFTLNALKERITDQFRAEVPPGLFDEADRRDILHGATDYILEMEAIRLTKAERFALIELIYAELFQFGWLNPYLLDPQITEITIDQLTRVFTRRGAEKPEAVQESFETLDSQEALLGRMVAELGYTYTPSEPFLEIGGVLMERRVRLTVAHPPISFTTHIGLRLHPPQRPTLDDLITTQFLSETDAQTILAALQKRRGMLVVGEVGSGKTTLLNALLPMIPGQVAVVERAAELTLLPDQTHFLSPAFGTELERALEARPEWVVADEIRFEEGQALHFALTQPADPLGNHPSFLASAQGSLRADRLFSSLSIAIQRIAPEVSAQVITAAVIERLPLVIQCGRRQSKLNVLGVMAWQLNGQQLELRPSL